MRVVSTFIFNLLLIWSVNAIRISPKLDFDEPEKRSLNVGFRPDTESRYVQAGAIPKSNFRRDVVPSANLENIGVICIAGNCTSTKTTTDNGNGISADVLVHIKTNVEVAKTKNDTMQTVPDVPIVVGLKTSTSPSFITNRPGSVPSPFIPPPIKPNYYPAGNPSPPSATNTFVPSRGPSFLPPPGLQTYSQTRGNTGPIDYAPRFQGNGNDIGLQSTYFRPYVNNYDNINYQFPLQMTWQSKGARGASYNPLEFRKTYSNTWNPTKWTGNNPSNSERRTENAIPRWTPCLCPNTDMRYPSTPGYPQSTQPSGVNGKVAPLF